MNILHVISSCEPKEGGPIEGIKQFNNYYKNFGIKAHILCSDKKKAKWLKDKRLPKVFATGPKKFDYAYNPKMLTWLDKNINKYDLIIVNGIWQYHNYAVWKIAKKFNKPYYVFTHGMLDPWFKKNYFFKHIKKVSYWNFIQYRILKDARSVLYTSNEEKRLAKKSFYPFNIKEKVIGYGIKGNLYKTNKKYNSFIKKFPETKNKRIILFFGRVHEKKGLDILIKCFIKIFSKNTNFHLVIAGPYNDKNFKELNRLIQNPEIKQSITWTGPLYNKLKWDAYTSSEIFCLPSHQENFGISVVEAMSCKKPVIITNKINIWKTIKKNSAGFVANDNVVSFYSSFMKYLKLNEKEYKKYCKNSYDCFIKNFQIKPITRNLANYLKMTFKLNQFK